MRIFRVKGVWGTKRVSEKKLRRKLTSRGYSGLEFVREEGTSGWSMLCNTPMFAEEVPVMGLPPEELATRRALTGKDTIVGLALIGVLWLSLAMPLLVTGDTDVLPGLFFAFCTGTAVLSPFLVRAGHALFRRYLQQQGMLLSRVIPFASPVTASDEDVMVLIEQLHKKLELMDPGTRRTIGPRVEARLNTLQKQLSARIDAEQEVGAIDAGSLDHHVPLKV